MGPQCKRVIRALDRHPAGICQTDFLAPNVIDGGEPITRLAARVHDLIHKHGQEIEVVGERHGCAVYARPVAREVVIPPPEPVTVEQEDGQLFALPTTNAIYGEAA